MTRGPRLTMTDNEFEGVRTVVRARGDITIDAVRNRFKDVGIAFDLAEEDAPPPELIAKALELMAEQQRQSGSVPTVSDAEEAAAKSGLKAWAKDKAVEIASFGIALYQIYTAFYLGK